MAVLKVEELSVSIGGNPIVAPLSFSLDSGKVLGISGESGAGKSMTALAIAGLLDHDAARKGRITLGGRRIDTLCDTAMSAVRGKQIGMIFQEPMLALNPLYTIGEQVAEVFTQHQRISVRQAKEKARSVLEKVGLPSTLVPPTRLPYELSGGQRQRVIIAMAIALKPKLLIADEPTTALDSITQMEILTLIRNLAAEEGMAVVLITHDLGVIATLADDLMIMQHGKVIEQGVVNMLGVGFCHPHAVALRNASIITPSSPTSPPTSTKAKPASPAPLMRVESVSYRYPQRAGKAASTTLSDINFSIGKGEILGLVGASGSGKTTLARLMLGLIAPCYGRISLNNETLPSPPKGGDVSAVFQDPYGSFNPRHPIGRLVTEPFYTQKPTPPISEQMAIAKALLGDVGINASYLDRPIHAASGGERQRIAFARALITHPELIVLDEPVSALDAPLRKKLLATMAKIARKHNIAALFISHDLGVVRSVCTRVMVMAQGRIVEDGATKDVFTTPQHEQTRLLLRAALDWQQILKNRTITLAKK